ncbi:MAG: extracellular solute-binding protein [Lachnospiraceae bacterium]|nr:extracellular solute-binding protein [Lachnospiraceae bacterium]
MKLKKVTALALTAAMCASMIGCGSTEAPAESAAPAESEAVTEAATEAAETEAAESEAPAEVRDVTLKVWGPQEDQSAVDGYDNGILAYMCDTFNEAHPEWNITFEYGVCGEDVAKDEVTKDVDAAADVYMFANDQLPILVESGAIAELGGTNLDAIKAANSESMMNTVTYQGGVYGVPFAYNGWFMFYDTSKFTEDEVKDLDTMLAKDLGDDVINVCFPLGNSWYIPAFYYGVGGTMFGADGTDGSQPCDFNDEKGLAVTNYLVDLAANENFTNQANEEAGKAISLFTEGKLGAFFTGSWDRGAIEEALGENFGCAQLPSFTAGDLQGTMKSFAGSKAIGVNPTCEDMDVAVALAVYLGSAECQKIRYEVRGVVPLDSTGIDDVMLNAITDTVNNTSVAQPLVSEMNGWWSPAEAFGKAIVAGEVTHDNAQEKLDTFVNNVNAGGSLE